MEKHEICRYQKIILKNAAIHLQLRVPAGLEQIQGIVISALNKQSEQTQQYIFPVKKKPYGNETCVEAQIALCEMKLNLPEWKIECLVNREGSVKNLPCVVTDKVMRKLFYIRDRSLKDVAEEHKIRFLLLASDYTVHLICRQQSIYDSRKYRYKELLAKIYFSLTKRYWKKRQIWVFFEKESKTAQDNGYIFFDYCLRQDTEKVFGAELYFALDSNVHSAKTDVFQDRHILKFYSWRHMMYLQAAKLLVSSESREQAVVWRNRNSFLRDQLAEKKLFFLQHGVIGLKKLPHFHKQSDGTCNRFITTSEYERDLVIRNLGYNREEAVVTGLARYDLLRDKSSELSKNVILMVPTWREWLDDVSEETFLNSEFYQIYQSLFTNKDWMGFLKKTDTWLHICIHPKAQQYQQLFRIDNPQIQLISYEDTRLSEELMKAKLLITDYSSVAWDMFYIEKPVLFFQFDEEQYQNIHGSYLQFPEELFGEQVKTIQELLKITEEYNEQAYLLKDEYAKMRDRYFQYHDRSNCSRIYKELQKYWNLIRG